MQELGDPFAADSAVTPHALAPSFDTDVPGSEGSDSTDSDRDVAHSDVRALQDLPFHRPEANDPFAMFEGPQAESGDSPIEGEATQIDEKHLVAGERTSILGMTPDPVVLSVESGKDRGKTFSVLNGATSIGRSIDNDVILTDISVSRKHLRIDLRGPELRVIDLRSGNGSLLNGQRVEESALYHEDLIQIGESVLRVEAPQYQRPVGPAWSSPSPGAPVAGPAPHPFANNSASVPPTSVHVDPRLIRASGRGWPIGRVLGLVVVAGLVFAVLGATVTAVVLGNRTEMPADSELEIANVFNQAQEALRRGRYREAREGFQRVVAQEPSDASAAEGLQRAVTALQHEQFVQEAERAASAERWSSAIELADRVPDGSRLEAEARDVARNARERWIGSLDAEARAALAAGDVDVARRHLGEAREAAPNDPRVDRLASDLAVGASQRRPGAEPTEERPDALRGTAARRAVNAAAARPVRRRSRRAERGLDARRAPSASPVEDPSEATTNRPSVAPIPVRPQPRTADAAELLSRARRLGSSSTAGCQAVRQVLSASPSSQAGRSMFAECVSNAERLMSSASSRPATAQRHLYLQVMGMVGQSHALFARAQRALGDLRRDEDE